MYTDGEEGSGKSNLPQALWIQHWRQGSGQRGFNSKKVNCLACGVSSHGSTWFNHGSALANELSPGQSPDGCAHRKRVTLAVLRLGLN